MILWDSFTLDQVSGIIINFINGANFPECTKSSKTLSRAPESKSFL